MGLSLTSFDTFLLIAGLITSLLALWLAIRAVFPRRVGDEPRCKRCGYQLQGLASDRCPECGIEISPANTVRGVRMKRPWLAGFAALLFLFGGTITSIGALHIGREIDWYRYRPTSWVIGDIDQSTSTDVRAWTEINRRIAHGGLSRDQQDRLADAAIKTLFSSTAFIAWQFEWNEILRQDANGVLGDNQRLLLIDRALHAQTNPTVALDDVELWNWTADQLLATGLSAKRSEAFLSHLITCHLNARQSIKPGSPLPYNMLITGRGPRLRNGFYQNGGPPVLYHVIKIERMLIDDRPVSESVGSSSGPNFTDGLWGSVVDPKYLGVPSGTHTLRLAISVRIYSVAPNKLDESTGRLMWQTMTPLSFQFEVLPPGQPDGVISKPDPSLQAAMESSFRCDYVQPTNYNGAGHGLAVTIEYTHPPANVAFDVFAVVDGKEHLIGSINIFKNTTGGYGTGGGDVNISKLSTVDLILRSSESAARATVDMNEIWQGEILLKNVKVRSP